MICTPQRLSSRVTFVELIFGGFFQNQFQILGPHYGVCGYFLFSLHSLQVQLLLCQNVIAHRIILGAQGLRVLIPRDGWLIRLTDIRRTVTKHAIELSAFLLTSWYAHILSGYLIVLNGCRQFEEFRSYPVTIIHEPSTLSIALALGVVILWLLQLSVHCFVLYITFLPSRLKGTLLFVACALTRGRSAQSESAASCQQPHLCTLKLLLLFHCSLATTMPIMLASHHVEPITCTS